MKGKNIEKKTDNFLFGSRKNKRKKLLDRNKKVKIFLCFIFFSIQIFLS